MNTAELSSVLVCTRHPPVMLLFTHVSVLPTPQDGRSALHLAAREGHVEVVQALLAAGADVEAVHVVSGPPPAYRSAMVGLLCCTGPRDCGMYMVKEIQLKAGARYQLTQASARHLCGTYCCTNYALCQY